MRKDKVSKIKSNPCLRLKSSKDKSIFLVLLTNKYIPVASIVAMGYLDGRHGW